jgi:hypothetical protein
LKWVRAAIHILSARTHRSPDCHTMSASNGPEEKDMTLIDLLECPDILELGVTEENEAKKRVAAIVDEPATDQRTDKMRGWRR